MRNDIFEIRGNINHTVIRLEQLTKEKEERERQEREARWAKEREVKEAVWKKEHFILDKYTYMSQWNWETYSWVGDYINMFFYEWSNIDSKPRHFPYSTEFYRFLDSSKLNLTDEINKLFRSKSGCHMICIPNTHNLLIAESYDELKEKFNLSKVIENVPEVKDNVNDDGSKSNVPAVISCKVYDDPEYYA